MGKKNSRSKRSFVKLYFSILIYVKATKSSLVVRGLGSMYEIRDSNLIVTDISKK